MTCNISEEQLWSWIDRDAPELDEHLAECPGCRARAEEMRAGIETVAVSSTPGTIPLPERIGSYVIKRLLGEGGQALVYEADQQAPRRPVALKVLKGGRFVGEHNVRHFQREIQTLASLQHPGIATIYEAGRTEEGQHFFAMERVDGVRLDVYVRENELPLAQRLALFRKVCEAVHYAHEHGVIHRDLKPSNILIDAEGTPKILDFGLARITDADVTLTTTATETGQIVGTLRYMSPEQARGHAHAIDVRSDVYALGVILYELMTNRQPYDVSKTMPEATAAICKEAPRRPASIDRALRGELETVVLKALEKEPSRRYRSAEELSQDVRRYLGGDPIVARPPSRLYVLHKKLVKQKLRTAIATTALGLGLIAVWGGSLWRHRSLEQQHAREVTKARRGALVAQRLAEAGFVLDALGRARAVFESYSDLADARLVMARALFENDKVYEAVRHLEQAPERDSSQWAYRALLLELRRRSGERLRAERLDALRRRDLPDDAEAWYLRSFATLDLERALVCAENAVQRNPKHTLAWDRRAWLCWQTLDLDGALRSTKRLIELGERDDVYRWTLFKAHILVRQNRCDEAVNLCSGLVTTIGGAEAYRVRADICLTTKRYDEAVEDYTEAFKRREPGSPYPWDLYRRATPRWIVGRLKGAAKDYRVVVAPLADRFYCDPHRLYLVLRDRAALLQKEGRGPDARQCLEDARSVLEAGRRDAAPGGWLEKIFQCLAGECAPSELVEFADRKDPAQVCEGYYHAGEACLLKNQLQEAREWFQKSVGTGLVFNPVSSTLEPMSPYHLARWRLEQLSADGGASQRQGQ